MWDEKYSNSQFIYGTAPNDFLRENVHHFVPEGKILCIAEGEGRNAVWLAELGFKVTAVDASELLQNELQGLTFERLQKTEREIIEGIGHTGMGSVVQVIGRR